MALEHTFTRTATIPTTTAGVSDAVSVAGGLPVAIITPSTWTAAAISFQASPIGSTSFYTLVNIGGAPVTSTGVTVNEWVNLDPAVFAGVDRLKLVSSSSQAAARTVTVVCLERNDRGSR